MKAMKKRGRRADCEEAPVRGNATGWV